MNYQEQLSVKLMRKLIKIASRQAPAKLTDDNITLFNIQFDLAYEEIYGYLPNGC